MTPEQRGSFFRTRFLQESFGTLLQTQDVYGKLLNALSDGDLQRLEELNVYFCRSFAPSVVTELRNTPSVDIMRLIIFENGYLRRLIPDEVVAIILHEIGHVFNPHEDLQEREFNADDFAILKGFGRFLKANLTRSITEEPVEFDDEINRARVLRIPD